MCEAIFAFFGTSSEEVAANATKEAQQKIDALSTTNEALASKNATLTSENTTLASENETLKALLKKHNIPLPAEQ